MRRPDTLAKEWARAAKLAGVKASFHSLRHTHCSQLIANGLDPATIAKRLGHSSPNITLGAYSHLFRDNDDRAVKILDAAFAARSE